MAENGNGQTEEVVAPPPEESPAAENGEPAKPSTRVTPPTVVENQDVQPENAEQPPPETAGEGERTVTTHKTEAKANETVPEAVVSGEDGGKTEETVTTPPDESAEHNEPPKGTKVATVIETQEVQPEKAEGPAPENIQEAERTTTQKTEAQDEIEKGEIKEDVGDRTATTHKTEEQDAAAVTDEVKSHDEIEKPTGTIVDGHETITGRGRTVKSSSGIKFEDLQKKDWEPYKPPAPKYSVSFQDNLSFGTTKSNYTYSKSNHSQPLSKASSASWSFNILPTESQLLHGARPNDSDLCLRCLVIEHHHSFEQNLLKNVCGSPEEPHECRTISVQKRGPRKFMQVCSDVDCPRFRHWKVIDSGGEGWKVDDAFAGGFYPPHQAGISSCFATSNGLCSKEQLVDLAQVGLGPRIMDEIRPDIEVSEWFCGRRDSTSRYGFKVSLLDSRQLMMYVYGQTVTLQPPEGAKWQKVTYTFRDYGPGVRYVLYHHGGSGEFPAARLGAMGDGDSHPGSKMAAASVMFKFPKGPKKDSPGRSTYNRGVSDAF